MRGVQPGLTTTPTKARHTQPIQVAAIGTRPCHHRVEVLHDLRIGHLVDHFFHEVSHGRVALCIPLANEQLRGQSHVAQLGKTAGDVHDMLVDAKDL